MQDQVGAAKQKGIKAELLNSSLKKKERDSIMLELRAMKPNLKMLYVTPELLDTDHFMKELIALDKRKLLAGFAVDEAHCIRCSLSLFYQANTASKSMGS